DDPTTLYGCPRPGRAPFRHPGPRVGRSGAQGGGAHRLGPHDAAGPPAGRGAPDGRARGRGDPRADAAGRASAGGARAGPVRQHQRVGGPHPQPLARGEPLRARRLALRQLLLGAARPGRHPRRPTGRAARRRAAEPPAALRHLAGQRVAPGGRAGHRPGLDAPPGGRRPPAAPQQRPHHPPGHGRRPRRQPVPAGRRVPVQQPARLLGRPGRLLRPLGRRGADGGGLRGEHRRAHGFPLPPVPLPAPPDELRRVVARGHARGAAQRVPRVAGPGRARSPALPPPRLARRRAPRGHRRLPPGRHAEPAARLL
ncbi:MAG: hypothetical protein AVDCRST_MAG68-498, partial [uncultured Gemmatimonadetes bacterium]